MKKLLVVLLTLLTLVGCSSGKVKGGDLDDIKSRGYIIVAMEGTWKPFTYHNEADELVGFDVEVAKYIADYLGVEVRYEEGEWDGLLMGIENGRYDIMVNGCDRSEEREQTYDLSDAYGYDKVVVMTRGEDDSINSVADLNGKTTANTISSTYAQIGIDNGATVQGVDDLDQTIQLLLQERIDATINAEVVYLDYIDTNPEANVKLACYTGDTYDIVIPMKKGSSALLTEVNKAIAQGHADGTFKALSMKYFGIDLTTK